MDGKRESAIYHESGRGQVLCRQWQGIVPRYTFTTYQSTTLLIHITTNPTSTRTRGTHLTSHSLSQSHPTTPLDPLYPNHLPHPIPGPSTPPESTPYSRQERTSSLLPMNIPSWATSTGIIIGLGRCMQKLPYRNLYPMRLVKVAYRRAVIFEIQVRAQIRA